MKLRIWRTNQFSIWRPNIWDVAALLFVLFLIKALAWVAGQMASPYQIGSQISISLSVSQLPVYALRTVFRIFIGLALSLFFTFTIGTIAAKSKHASRVIVPMIDILQSVPVLGFLSVTVVGFIKLFPNSLMGPECAAIFAIFTAQAWNICLGFYQSMRTVPNQLLEASAVFQLTPWQQFWKIEAPFAMPSLIWNMMMSISASWFFIVAAEAITVNNQTILLPGIGSYIAVAIAQRDKAAIIYSIVAMASTIFLYDQLFFKPIIQWSDKFKIDGSDSESRPKSFVMMVLQKTRLLHHVGKHIGSFFDMIINARLFGFFKSNRFSMPDNDSERPTVFLFIWHVVILLLLMYIVIMLWLYMKNSRVISEIPHVALLGFYTAIRIIILVFLCSLFWVPIGVWIGFRPRVAQWIQPIAQFFAAFPANLVFPAAVIFIVHFKLNVEIWLTPLMILGTQWYILFNVIAGTTAIPKDLVYATRNFNVKGWLWWRKFILPGIFPYYITGAITAAGGAWNASIVAEVVSWGDNTLKATGLGAYISEVTRSGDFPRIALGISMMCVYVLLINRIIWRPLYSMAERHFQMD